ncbi:uncharacterized protein ACA1_109580 [Acanthamoeba castellanii str. Neff]|uniref:Uncharacterized protein n=1 Tax=Acanthamoeba castellanii (strain ATCC 30010 / Neff) TaxID=1257118 RepID=L8HB21_ACACF|nr:uncharacterized protein ACA1_109580 [Acanthamoeba castellanii str. Neff]ELR22704.1 hypothetical protein ACA1_109580 [Acanthamoeba castellanii str. Neff]
MAYTLKWEWHYMLQSLVVQMTDGKFWGKVELLCDEGYFKLRNALFFGTVLPLGYTTASTRAVKDKDRDNKAGKSKDGDNKAG